MSLIKLRYYRFEVKNWRAPGCFRLAFLSDLHNNIAPGLLEQLREAQPQAVLIGGDMINKPIGKMPARFTRGYGLVRRLAAEFPVYYALGNHEASWKNNETGRETWDRYRKALEKKGVVFLENASARLGDEEHPLTVTGADLGRTAYSHHKDRRRAPEPAELRESLGEAQPYQILLPHHPDYIETYQAWGADLVLAGHLHGGQARLPFVGGVISPGLHLFPPYTKGLYSSDACVMLVSPGLGTHTVPFRIFNPREAYIVDLVKE